ncbi:uncharacterized protein LOC105645360 [Jatropha curcas]|uniref:uncharacterized protein LOC105645360 n=1 Tax=Jatropha curcas TaxID=180498 RepID=UPI0005FB2EC8|nr:uncharacterized protein LOC105645360 [Jatropha curcas]
MRKLEKRQEEDIQRRIRAFERKAIPFPQRLRQKNLDNQLVKFLEMLKQLYVNIPFFDIMTQMPTYAKFLKEILMKKRKMEESETLALIEDYSAMIQNKLPPKMKDLGSFSIPCEVGAVKINKAFCDLKASVNLMPLSIFDGLNIGELKPTLIVLQLADRFIKYPSRIIEDGLVKVGKFYIPVDFVVLEMEDDAETPILLG